MQGDDLEAWRSAPNAPACVCVSKRLRVGRLDLASDTIITVGPGHCFPHSAKTAATHNAATPMYVCVCVAGLRKWDERHTALHRSRPRQHMVVVTVSRPRGGTETTTTASVSPPCHPLSLSMAESGSHTRHLSVLSQWENARALQAMPPHHPWGGRRPTFFQVGPGGRGLEEMSAHRVNSRGTGLRKFCGQSLRPLIMAAACGAFRDPIYGAIRKGFHEQLYRR